ERKSAAKAMSLLLSDSADGERENFSERTYGNLNHPHAFVELPSFEAITGFYGALAVYNKVPKFQELLKEASQELGISSLKGNPIEENMYYRVFSNELTLHDSETVPGERTAKWLQDTM